MNRAFTPYFPSHTTYGRCACDFLVGMTKLERHGDEYWLFQVCVGCEQLRWSCKGKVGEKPDADPAALVG